MPSSPKGRTRYERPRSVVSRLTALQYAGSGTALIRPFSGILVIQPRDHVWELTTRAYMQHGAWASPTEILRRWPFRRCGSRPAYTLAPVSCLWHEPDHGDRQRPV